jgi:hypothetical protein
LHGVAQRWLRASEAGFDLTGRRTTVSAYGIAVVTLLGSEY